MVTGLGAVGGIQASVGLVVSGGQGHPATGPSVLCPTSL